MAEEILALTHVHFQYDVDSPRVIDLPALRLGAGEHLLIRGRSGSGKTTLLNLITGIHQPSSGNVTLLGQNLRNLSGSQRDRLRADYLGVIFQQLNLLPYLSLLENVQVPCWFSKRRAKLAANSKQSAGALLQELGIAQSLFSQPVTNLSVGQQQRVALARAMMGRPKLMIADEPTSALDEENRDSFLDLLFAQARQHNTSLIFVSHDSAVMNRFDHQLDLSETKGK